MKRVLNFTGLTIEKADDSNYQLTHYISTDTPDRYGDVVVPNGYLKYEDIFRKNAIVLFGHASRELPIGNNLWLKVMPHGVLALTQFDKGSEKSKEIYRLNKEGFLKGWSIGFIPRVEVFKEDSEGIKRNFIEEWEMLEYSSVPIPANPDALNLALKDCRNDDVKEILQKENEFVIFKNDINALINELKSEVESVKSAGVILTKEEIETLIKSQINFLDKTLAKKLIKYNKSLEFLYTKIK